LVDGIPVIPAIIGRFMDSFRPHAWWSLERSRAGCGALLAWRPVGLVGSCAVVDQLESPRVRWRPPYLEGESFLPAPAGQVGGPGWVRRSTATMPQPRSGALRVAAGQLIWSSHPAPAARAPRPAGGRPGRSLPDLRSRRPATAARTGAKWPAARAPRCWRRPRPGPAPASQGSRRRAAAAWLTYLPTVSLAGQRSPHAQRRGNQPSALPHTASTAPSRQTRPRRPPDPAPAPSATCPGSTGSADERTCVASHRGIRCRRPFCRHALASRPQRPGAGLAGQRPSDQPVVTEWIGEPPLAQPV